jgi:hypothetical protein
MVTTLSPERGPEQPLRFSHHTESQARRSSIQSQGAAEPPSPSKEAEVPLPSKPKRRRRASRSAAAGAAKRLQSVAMRRAGLPPSRRAAADSAVEGTAHDGARRGTATGTNWRIHRRICPPLGSSLARQTLNTALCRVQDVPDTAAWRGMAAGRCEIKSNLIKLLEGECGEEMKSEHT